MAEIYTNDRNLKASVYYDAALKSYKIYFEGTYDSIGLYLTQDGLNSLSKEIKESQQISKLQSAI